MKKCLLMAAACVALASCVKDEANVPNVNQASDAKITFEAPVIDPATRALIDNGENFEGDFSIVGLWYANGYTTFGADGSIAYMGSYTKDTDGKITGATGVTATKCRDDDKIDEKYYWITNPVYYWPKNQGSITFQAFSPSTLNAKFTDSGVEIATYSIPATHDVDVLFSERSYDRTSSTNSYTASNNETNPYTGVDIRFKHALSSIKFKAKADQVSTGTVIVLKSIELHDMHNTGTNFDQGIQDGTSAVTSTTLTHWGSTSGAADYTNITTSLSQTLTTQAADVNHADLIVMPQLFTDGGQKVQISYEINGVPQIATADLFDLTYSGNTNTTNTKGFEVGKQYTFTISIAMNKIYFAPVVDNWTPVTGSGDLQ